MKTSHIILLVLSIFFVFFIFYDILSQQTIEFSDKSIAYANDLTAACHDAAKTIQPNIHGNLKVWDSTGKIENTLNIFYETLSRSMGLKNTVYESNVNEKTPFVFLVDYDGYYMVYCACFDETGNSIVPENLKRTAALTSLNTWTVQKGNYLVRYYLNDHIEIITGDNTVYTGKVKDVYESMTTSGEDMVALSYLADEEAYLLERTATIVGEMEENINYVLNTQIANVDGYNTGYQVSLATVKSETWCRALINPTIISFVQGEQLNTSFMGMDNLFLNVFAFAGGETRFKPGFVIWNEQSYESRQLETQDMTVTENNLLFNIGENTLGGEIQDEYYPALDEIYSP